MSDADEELLGSRSRDWGGRSLGPEGRAGAARVRKARAGIALVLAVVDVGAFVMTVGNLHGPLRFAFGLILGVIVPGWSLVGLVRLGNLTLEISLALAVGLAVMLVVAQVLMTVHEWHLISLEEVTAALCLPSLIWQSMRLRAPRGQSD